MLTRGQKIGSANSEFSAEPGGRKPKMSVDADGPFLTDRVCSNTTLCKLGVPSKKFSITKGFGDFKGGKIRQKVESKSMAKNEHLRSVFDWIQIQFDKTEFSPKEIIEDILFLDFDLFIENKGSLKYYNYDSQLHYGNIRIYYGSKESSYMLVMSGQALEFYRDMVLDPNSLSERQFLNNLYYNYIHFSVRRIDIAIDDFNETPYFTPNQLLKICQKKRFLYGKSKIGRASCRERVLRLV